MNRIPTYSCSFTSAPALLRQKRPIEEDDLWGTSMKRKINPAIFLLFSISIEYFNRGFLLNATPTVPIILGASSLNKILIREICSHTLRTSSLIHQIHNGQTWPATCCPYIPHHRFNFNSSVWWYPSGTWHLDESHRHWRPLQSKVYRG